MLTPAVRRRLPALGAMLLTAAAAIAPWSPVSATPSGIHEIGSVQVNPCPVYGTGVDSVTGVYFLIHLGASCGTPVVSAISTRTLKLLGETHMENTDSTVFILPQLLQVDSVHHRLVTVWSSAIPYTGHNGVAVYNETDFTSGKASATPEVSFSVPDTLAQSVQAGAGVGVISQQNPTAAAGDNSLHPQGSTYDPVSDTVYMTLTENYGGTASVSSAHGPGTQDVYVSGWNVGTGHMVWMQLLGACEYASTTFAADLTGLPDPLLVYHNPGDGTPGTSSTQLSVGCIGSRVPGVYPDPTKAQSGCGAHFSVIGGNMLTYVLPLDSTGMPIQGGIKAYLGRPDPFGAIAGPDLGRMYWIATPSVVSSDSAAPGPTAVVFDSADLHHLVYLAAPTVGTQNQGCSKLSVTYSGSRLYSVGAAGITIVDMNTLAPEEGLFVSAYDCPPTFALADRTTGRLLVQYQANCTDNGQGPEPRVRVLEDSIPSLVPPPDPPVDSGTQQIEEKPGLTDSAFGAESQASGTRIRLIGGPAGFLRGSTFGVYFDLEPTLASYWGTAHVAAPNDVSREVSLAQLTKLALDNFQSSAAGAVADIDDSTQNDLGAYSGNSILNPAKPQGPPQYNIQSPYEAQNCTSPGSTGATKTYATDSGVTVSCDVGQKLTSGSVTAGPYSLSLMLNGNSATPPLPILIGQSAVDGKVYLDGDNLVHSVSHSVVKGVDLGVAAIRSVEARTECVAKGHTSTAHCTFRRVIAGVVDNTGTPLDGGSCVQQSSPMVDTCSALVDKLNTLDPGYVIFSLPQPDDRSGYFGGSPGGYQSVSTRELYTGLQDRILNYDSSKLVPGLQVQYIQDSFTSPSRLVVQLAGVYGESHRGVNAVVQDTGGGDLTGAVTTITNTVVDTIPGPEQTLIQRTPPRVFVLRTAPISMLVQKALDGLGFMARNPLGALLISPLLGLLFAPLLVAWRRRVLLRALSQS